MVSNFSFLEIVAEFIIDKFGKQNLKSRIKIILPNIFACKELQKILTLNYQITILPVITPFTAIIAEKKDSSNNLISSLEEKLILAEVIVNYGKLKFSMSEALKAAELLSKLFNELVSNNISIKSIETYNDSKYWQKIYKFLEYSFDEWQTKIILLDKQSRAAYELTILQEEITNIKNSKREVIVAGLFAENPITKKFLQELALLSSVSIIPSNYLDSSKFHFYTGGNLEKLNLDSCLPSNDIESRNDIENSSHATTSYFHDDIFYAEPTNIYAEAEQIALICKQYSNKRIAIIIDNQKAKEMYCNFLAKYSLAFTDMLGNALSNTNISQILITISKILCNDFDLKTLFLLLKNPLINSLEIQKLELLLANKNRFIYSPKHLLLIMERTEDEQLITYCRELITVLFEVETYGVYDILKAINEIAEKLYPSIWQENGGKEILELLANLTNFSRHISIENKQDFPKIFSSLISNIRYFDNEDATNIIIGSPKDLALSKFDLVLLPNFNNESWPLPAPIHPWLSKEAKKQLKIDYEEIATALSLYYFHLFLHNKQVIILRAKKQDGKSTLPSNFFLKLQLILGEKLLPLANDIQYYNPAVQHALLHGSLKASVCHSCKGGNPEKSLEQVKLYENLVYNPLKHFLDSRFHENDIENLSHATTQVQPNKNQSKGVYSNNFPAILSVTDIEILIRNPYSFYAKKILNLRKKDMIWEEPKISDFGNFIHKILEQYSKNYDEYINFDSKQKHLINIGTNILQHTVLPAYTKKTWQIKLLPIAKAFITFDDERRKNCKNIYFELRRELQLNIAGQNIKIIGIADRIEINKLNQITILDYKTGAIPSKKEIESGLSPQLIIEALMILENGFAVELNLDPNITIAYVKISSSEPYIQLTEIKLSKEELMRHKNGLITLLEHYVINKFFPYNVDLLKYNDYFHLERNA